MSALAPAALAVSVVLSALGAVVLCVLVVLYGFTPAGEEPPGAAARRQLVTRLGHAVAAVCFTATAILIAVILAQSPRPAAPLATLADARVPALGVRLDAQELRLAQTEARLNDLEPSLRREAASPVQMAAPAPERVAYGRAGAGARGGDETPGRAEAGGHGPEPRGAAHRCSGAAGSGPNCSRAARRRGARAGAGRHALP